MNFKDQSLSKSLLWFFISVFLFFWLGSHLLGAVTNLEIQDLRITGLVTFSSRPIWFSIVVALKASAWALSSVLIYKYVQFKVSNKNT
ncbi:MAG: hypothetical protein ACJAW7_001603 [Candidatus Azotimanducaceae bacterium]|jgi:hypothetical protein